MQYSRQLNNNIILRRISTSKYCFGTGWKDLCESIFSP